MKLIETMRKGAALAAAAVLLGGAVPAQAYQYGWLAGVRAVDLDVRGTRGQVQEYDGKYYKGVHGDLGFWNAGSFGLFDFSAKDLGSTEEAVNVRFDRSNGFKVSGKWETMHHRLNLIQAGVISNGQYFGPTGSTLATITPADELVMRRTESELNVSKTSLVDPRHRLAVQYWRADKYGSSAFSAGPRGGSNIMIGRINIDNTTEDVTVSVGVGAGADSQVTVDLVRNEFTDRAAVVARETGTAATSALGGLLKPHYSDSEMTAAELRFRTDVRDNLAVSGAFTGRRRHAVQNDMSNDFAVATVNAAYRPSKKLSVLGKVYFRGNQVRETQGIKRSLAEANPPNRHQIDKNHLRTDLSATYRATQRVTVKGSYRLELINRRDPRTYTIGSGFFFDGTFFPMNAWRSEVAGQETRHVLTGQAKAALPLGIEAEATLKRLQANRPAFVNQPNQQDDASAGLTVPLPADLTLSLLANYIQERNKTHSFDRNYSSLRNTYRAGLDGALFNKVFFGADGAWDNVRYFADVGFASPAAAFPTNNYREAGMNNRQTNTTAGLHARANLPKGFVVSGNGSYTWSDVSTPMTYRNAALGYTIDDYTPYDIRIARGTMAVDYTPLSYDSLTARVSYSIQDWVDKIDNANSGRVSISQVGLTAKF
ncbi:MAG: hypothetical protein HYZ75_03310 [Elusimicrobia bacterium]|nr:hypothetical protein [Elusimicrobiota bacterium]